MQMKSIWLKYVALCGVLFSFSMVAPSYAAAQSDGVNGPPKVLFIEREFTKPGRDGALHEKSESEFVSALREAKAPMHYLALQSISGPNRALFLMGYSSFADMAETHKDMAKIPGLNAKLDAMGVRDGDLLASESSSIWVLNTEQSMNMRGLTGDRLMEISKYVVKPGHGHEWDEVLKMVKDAYAKGVPDASWAMYDQAYGADGDAHLIIVPLKSMAEIDHNFTEDKNFMDAMGPDGMKKLEALMASCVESSMTNLFAFSPKMSNPPEAWVKAEPDFWRPKPMAPKKK
jgi:hypothetical protein